MATSPDRADEGGRWLGGEGREGKVSQRPTKKIGLTGMVARDEVTMGLCRVEGIGRREGADCGGRDKEGR